MITMANEVTCTVGALRPVTVHYANITDIESIPHEPGFYGWFYIPSHVDGRIIELYRQYRPSTTVEGLFNLKFHGDLRPAGVPEVISDAVCTEPEALEALRAAFLAFGPVLYFGISSNLRQRLKCHRAKVQQSLAQPGGLEVSHAQAPPPDTEQESAYFGARIACALNGAGLSADDLYVRCMVVPDVAVLRPVERVVNVAMSPHYGRR